MMVSKNQYWENEVQNNKQDNSLTVQYATVIRLVAGKPVLRFVGDYTESGKDYVYLKHYVPAIGDRVMLINNIIQGGWRP